MFRMRKQKLIVSGRIIYSKELAKVRKSTVERSGMGTDELVPSSKWPHFQSMAFLRDSITQEKQY